MGTFLTSTVAFVVAIGILVAVHEFGHFSIARLIGVKVLRFSIGFGKPLWLRRAGRDRTEYCISAIPLGGYVKLLDEREGEIAEAERHRAFNAQPLAGRIAVLLAGPLFNFVFAVIAFWMMFCIGVPGIKPIVGEVTADSLAGRAGLMERDRIVMVGGREVATWNTAVMGMLDSALATGRISMEVSGHDGRRRSVDLPITGLESELTEPGRLFKVLGFEMWSPSLPAVIGDVVPGGAADKAGMLPGDRVVTADDEPISSWPEWVKFIRARPGKTIRVGILRDGRQQELSITLDSVESGQGVIGRIGAGTRVPEGFFDATRAMERYSPVPAFAMSVGRTWEMAVLTVRMVSRMVTGDVSVRNISGPISIAQFVGLSATVGAAYFLRVLAIISLSLGILNLLPVPILDGGQVVYQLIEAVKGSPLSERARMLGQQVGMLFLLMLMSFAFYNDLARIFG